MAAYAKHFTLRLEVVLPCDDDGDVAYTDRELERLVLHHLRKLEGDCDCEVMEQKPITEDEAMELMPAVYRKRS